MGVNQRDADLDDDATAASDGAEPRRGPQPHPPWIRITAFVVIAMVVLATAVAALF